VPFSSTAKGGDGLVMAGRGNITSFSSQSK
jgi:hypothetical protein